MIQALACALHNSALRLRCLPVAVTILQLCDGQYVVDPCLKQLRETRLTKSKTRMAFNVDTEELLMSYSEQNDGEGMDFESVE